jgi:hypothetical protein
LTVAVIVAAIGILNVGVSPAAAECTATGGGGGGGGSPTPTGSAQPTGSGSPSSSGAQSAPVDQLPLPAQSSSASPSGSASPSSTDGGGPLPNLSTILPGGDDSASPTGSGASGSPTSGGGGGQDCPTKLTISYTRASTRTTDPRDHFGGKVKSPNAKCIRGRDVILKKVKGGKAKTVGRTVSTKNGSWKIQGVTPKGRFYAQSPARNVGAIACRKGKSKTISP